MGQAVEQGLLCLRGITKIRCCPSALSLWTFLTRHDAFPHRLSVSAVAKLKLLRVKYYPTQTPHLLFLSLTPPHAATCFPPQADHAGELAELKLLRMESQSVREASQDAQSALKERERELSEARAQLQVGRQESHASRFCVASCRFTSCWE